MGYLTFERLHLPYNEVGRYFDITSQVVLKKDAVVPFCVITATFLILSLLLFAGSKKMSGNK